MNTRVILLAGGQGRRLGGSNKALLRRHLPDRTGSRTDVGGGAAETLLHQWCTALTQRQLDGVVVGDPGLERHLTPAASALLRVTQEDPPFSGPAAAVCAGVRALPTVTTYDDAAHRPPEQVLLCAVDIVEPDPLLDWLLGHASHTDTQPSQDGLLPHDGLLAHDAQGRPQWLASLISTEWLRRRVATIAPGEEQGRSLRWLLGAAELRHLAMPPHLGHDVDEPDQATRWGIQL